MGLIRSIASATGEFAAKARNATLKGVKLVANAAIDVVFTSNENSELSYRYREDKSGNRFECRQILGATLVDLAMKRSRDSYLRLILSRCAGVDLEKGPGRLVYFKDFRSLCAMAMKGDRNAVQEIVHFAKAKGFAEGEIEKALDVYRILFKRCDYGGFIREIFVASVGEDIYETVYDDNGEIVRDANGNALERVVGRNDAIARFKVVFSSGHKIGLKVHLENGSDWSSLRPHEHI